MSLRSDAMIAEFERQRTSVISVPLGVASGSGLAALRSDLLVAPNMNYLLGVVFEHGPLLDAHGTTCMLWDDPLGALALWLLGRRSVPMGSLGPPGSSNVLEEFREVTRHPRVRHFAWDSGHAAAMRELDLVAPEAVSWYPIATFEPFVRRGAEPAEPRFDVGFCGNVYPSLQAESSFATDELYETLTRGIAEAKAVDLERPVWSLLRAELSRLPVEVRTRHGLEPELAPFWDYYLYLAWVAVSDERPPRPLDRARSPRRRLRHVCG